MSASPTDLSTTAFHFLVLPLSISCLLSLGFGIYFHEVRRSITFGPVKKHGLELDLDWKKPVMRR